MKALPCLLALSLCLLLPVSAQAQGSTPEEVWTQYKAAHNDKKTDAAAILKLSTESYQVYFAEQSVMAAGMSTMGDKARRAKLFKIMAAHGFSERDRVTPKKYKAIKDKAKFLSDVLAFIETSKKTTLQIPTGKLEALATKGEQAQAKGPHRAKGKPRAKPRSVPLGFKRVKGKWYLDVPAPSRPKK